VHDSHDVEEKRPSGAILKSLLVSRLRKRLTRKASAKDVVVKDLLVDGLVRVIRVLIFDILTLVFFYFRFSLLGF
jgi:hypothetical protein